MLPGFKILKSMCFTDVFVLVIFDLFNKVILKLFSCNQFLFWFGVNVLVSVLLFKDFINY